MTVYFEYLVIFYSSPSENTIEVVSWIHKAINTLNETACVIPW